MFDCLKQLFKGLCTCLTKHSLLIASILSLIPLLLYICNFGMNGISDDLEDWAYFGNYVGGVYSIVVALFVLFLARKLERNDKRKEKRQEAIDEIYSQFCKMKNCPSHKLAQSVNKFFRKIEQYRLCLTDDQFNKMQGFGNYFLNVANSPSSKDPYIEEEMKIYLLSLYN